jgi:hypothetical protein
MDDESERILIKCVFVGGLGDDKDLARRSRVCKRRLLSIVIVTLYMKSLRVWSTLLVERRIS